MEAHRHFGRLGSGSRNQGWSSRRSSILVAALSAVLAAALIYLFVTHYRRSSPAPAAVAQVTVWEATQYIPRGTPQSVIAAEGLLKSTQIPATQALTGAIADPSAIAGEASSVAISKGEQVTALDFTRANAALSSYLKGDQRAVAFALDPQHGLTAYLQVGDTVDVMAVKGNGSTEMLAQNVTVLANQAGDVVLRLTDRQALLVTAATGKASLWLSLRPALGAKDSVQVGSVGS